MGLSFFRYMAGTSHCFNNKVLIMCKISNSFHSYISLNSTHLFIDVHRTIPSLSFMSLITYQDIHLWDGWWEYESFCNICISILSTISICQNILVNLFCLALSNINTDRAGSILVLTYQWELSSFHHLSVLWNSTQPLSLHSVLQFWWNWTHTDRPRPAALTHCCC